MLNKISKMIIIKTIISITMITTMGMIRIITLILNKPERWQKRTH